MCHESLCAGRGGPKCRLTEAGRELKKHNFIAGKRQNGTKLNWEILMIIHTGKHRESRTAMVEDMIRT